MYSYIRKYLFIFLFLSCKYVSINLSNRKFVLNVKGNSDNLYFYYITLLLGKEKQSQSFILDTTSSTTTSPCNFCTSCGDHMNDYYIINSNSSIIDLNSEECKSLPNTLESPMIIKDKQLDKGNCYFLTKIEKDEILGIYSTYLISEHIWYLVSISPSEKYPPSLFKHKVNKLFCSKSFLYIIEIKDLSLLFKPIIPSAEEDIINPDSFKEHPNGNWYSSSFIE